MSEAPAAPTAQDDNQHETPDELDSLGHRPYKFREHLARTLESDRMHWGKQQDWGWTLRCGQCCSLPPRQWSLARPYKANNLCTRSQP